MHSTSSTFYYYNCLRHQPQLYHYTSSFKIIDFIHIISCVSVDTQAINQSPMVDILISAFFQIFLLKFFVFHALESNCARIAILCS